MTDRILPAVSDGRIRTLAMIAILAAFGAAYPLAKSIYSTPQQTVSQWLIEFRAGEDKVHIELRYERHDGANSDSHSNGFQILPSELIGLTREQAMSSGAQVHFQIKRDAGAFDCEGWFKEGSGAGHFTFVPSAAFVAELERQGFGEPTFEQQFSMAMNNTSLAF